MYSNRNTGEPDEPVDVYGGNKGGFGYLIAYDNTKSEIIDQYIAPPDKTTRSVGVSGAASGLASIGVKYKSQTEFGKSFAVENSSKSSTINLDQISPLINDRNRDNGKPKLDLDPQETVKLAADRSFIAGQYVMPVVPKNIERPSFDSHFEDLDKNLESGLNISSIMNN